MGKFRVLHLSDLHIGNTYTKSEDIAYRIITDIENENLNKDIKSVLVTGDIFEGAKGYSESLINEAVDFFNIIYEQLKNSTGIEKDDFLFVPGNHDIIRTNNLTERWKKYKAFLEKFFGRVPESYNPDDYSWLKAYEKEKIVFAGLNSCGLEENSVINEKAFDCLRKISDDEFKSFDIDKEKFNQLISTIGTEKEFNDFGEISPKQILYINRELKKYSDFNIISLFHHHFYLFPEIHAKYGDSSLIRGYTNIIQRMQQVGVKTVLHGHKHYDLERPIITDSYYENANNIINVIAGGSVATMRTQKHTFNIIDFYDKADNYKIIQRKFVYNDDQLEPVIIRSIPPEMSETKSIHLYNDFRLNSSDLFSKYNAEIERINIAANDYSNIVTWLENAFLGFNEIHKIFQNNPNSMFFLLFSMNYRVLKIKEIIGKENFDKSYYSILDDLLFKSISEIGFDKQEYLKIFEQQDISKLKEKCDAILDSVKNKEDKYNIAFTMIAIFITDIYMMLRYYAGYFYEKYIKYKVNINLDESMFHQSIPVQKIMFHSDADRRSASIDLKCNSATAHKLAVLFVKEFELIISKFEDYFRIVGLKLYYLVPRIEKNEENAIDNYNFEAYIPTLIPLLTGDNIYSKKEVFARELIQNSIDAIAVRESMGQNFDKTIYITLGKEADREYFRIKDAGTGMDRFKIERYFTSIGRSFYSGNEYKDLDIDYKPISNFGIGFLSAFMVCREIDVKTKYYLEDSVGLKLHIPNYDGCFFIEQEENVDIGTEITLYIDKQIGHNISLEAIAKYISDTMRDIQYDIQIDDRVNQKKQRICAFKTKNSLKGKDILFVPFSESEIGLSNIELEDIWSENYKERYKYGLMVNLANKDSMFGCVLNSGIKLNNTTPEQVWTMLTQDKFNINIASEYYLFNFPPNYFEIDVSRENITSLSKKIRNINFYENLINILIKQLKQYFINARNNNIEHKAINIYNIMMHIANMSNMYGYQNAKRTILKDAYILGVQFSSNSIELVVCRESERSRDVIKYTKNNNQCYKNIEAIIIQSLKNNGEEIELKSLYNSSIDIYRMLIFPLIDNSDEFDISLYMLPQRKIEEWLKEILNVRKVDEDKHIKLTCGILLVIDLLLGKNINKHYYNTVNTLLGFLLTNYSVSEIETDQARVRISKEDFTYIIKSLITKKKDHRHD